MLTITQKVEQLDKLVTELTCQIANATPASDGRSAYEVAIDSGEFVGTEAEWLASLVGDTGKSAYQLAQDLGYNDTLENWLASLKGDKGDKGDTGYKTVDPIFISPSEPTPTVQGSYKPMITSLDNIGTDPVNYGTLYPNINNFRAKEGYDTLFNLANGVWKKYETKLAQATKYIPLFETLTFPVSAPTQSIYANTIWRVKDGQTATITDIPADNSAIWLRIGDAPKEINTDLLFAKYANELPDKQFTATGTTTTTAVTNVHGISTSIGTLLKTFSKVNIVVAQNPATPITQIEVRIFKGKIVGGELIIKKRQTVTASTSTNIAPTIDLGGNITYNGEMWIQILTNNPFSYTRVSTPTRSQAAGYGQPFVTTINNLDATTFPNSQGWTDIYLEFNSVDTGIKLTNEGEVIITSSLTEIKNVDVIPNYTALNNYLKPDGTMAVSQNWRTSEPTYLEHGGKVYLFFGRNTTISVGVVGYKADNSVVVLVPTGDFSINPYAFTVPDDIVYTRACGYVDQPPFIIEQQSLVKEKYTKKDKRIYVPITWHCLGHSIWANDGVAINANSVYEGIQTHVRRIFKFAGYNRYCYSGHSLGAQSLSDTSSLALKLSVFTDPHKGFWTIDTITNDFRRNIPIGTIADYNNATGALTYYGALRMFKDRLLALQPADFITRVIAFNALKRDNAGYTSTSANTAGHTLLDYEKALMSICFINGWEFVDQHRESGITDETLAYTTNDGLHPNNFGYNLVKRPVIRAIWILVKEYYNT